MFLSLTRTVSLMEQTQMHNANHIIAYYRCLIGQLDSSLDRQGRINRALAYVYQERMLAYTWG